MSLCLQQHSCREIIRPDIDRVTMTSLLSTIYVQCCRRHVAGKHYGMKTLKITRVLLCLLTAALRATKITQKHTPLVNQLYITSRIGYGFYTYNMASQRVDIDIL